MKNLDASNLKATIEKTPEQFTRALEFSRGIHVPAGIRKAVVLGMGGSALPADIVRAVLGHTKTADAITVCRDYALPSYADEHTLLIASSYSGNTEETLTALGEGIKRGFPVVGLSRGGKLAKVCAAYKIPHIDYPDDGPTFQPRYASGYAFTAMLSVLHAAKLAPDMSDHLRELSRWLKEQRLEAKGKALAEKTHAHIPLIYTSERYGAAVARIIKIKFNESAKTQSFWNTLPELNHNEMVGFTKLAGKYFLLLFDDPAEHVQIRSRMRLLKELLAGYGVLGETIEMQGETTLQKVWWSLSLGDWMTYWAALANGVDPTPVDMVEEFKKKLETA